MLGTFEPSPRVIATRARRQDLCKKGTPLVRSALLAATLAVAIALPARAAEQKHLAVLEFELAQGVKIDRTYFSDLARGAVKKHAPQLFVMTRESTEALLQANGKTMADCTGECEVEVGRKLGADWRCGRCVPSRTGESRVNGGIDCLSRRKE